MRRTWLREMLTNGILSLVPWFRYFNAAIRILRYIKGAPSLGLFFSSTTSVHLKAFCDSDWGTCSDSRQSVTGFSVYLGNSLISWKSKKQKVLVKLNTGQWPLLHVKFNG